MRTRRLVLAKETLTELHAEELTDVVGAAQAITSLNVRDCLERVTSQVVNCVTLFEGCTTL